jgi:NAD-dependent deacetylase
MSGATRQGDALDAAIDTVAARLRRASHIVALTGAGVSAASGIPTFRCPEGLWKNFRAEALATSEAFANDPKLVWEWYDWRRSLILAAKPNPAHDVLARWTREGIVPQASRPKSPALILITQNVDGLHERAGSEDVLRLHGSIWQVRCWQNCEAGRTDWLDTTVPQPHLPPLCPHCGGLVRPAVVWFGESLDQIVIAHAIAAAESADVFLTIGTSAVVYPAAGLVHQARRRGALTVEINTETTAASEEVHISILGPAAEVLTRIDEAVARQRPSVK